MKRSSNRRLRELEDLPWLPSAVREGGTDYLRFFLKLIRFYDPVIPLLRSSIEGVKAKKVVDLCSGGGGYIETIAAAMQKDLPVTFELTDKFPNLTAFERIAAANRTITFNERPVDALEADIEAGAIATMFSAAHHFSPGDLTTIMRNAAAAGRPLLLFDGGNRNALIFLGVPVVHGFLFFFCTPFIKPLSVSRLLFTYLLPLIPLMTVYDGMVSILRLHKLRTLRACAKAASSNHYEWKVGRLTNRLGFAINYVVGKPL